MNKKSNINFWGTNKQKIKTIQKVVMIRFL